MSEVLGYVGLAGVAALGAFWMYRDACVDAYEQRRRRVQPR